MFHIKLITNTTKNVTDNKLENISYFIFVTLDYIRNT